MYCIKCGNKLKSENKYCTNCGYPANSNIQSTNNINQCLKDQDSPKTNTTAIIIAIISTIVIIGIIILFIILIFFSVNTAINEYETMDYITFENDKIPSLYHVIGEKNICNISTSNNFNSTQYNLTYCDNSLTKNEISDYLNYLIEEEDFTEIKTDYNQSVIKDSYDTNMKIKITIDYSKSSITYYKYYQYSTNYDNYENNEYI